MRANSAVRPLMLSLARIYFSPRRDEIFFTPEAVVSAAGELAVLFFYTRPLSAGLFLEEIDACCVIFHDFTKFTCY